MDDSLLAHYFSDMLQIILKELIEQLQRWGIIVAPERIQTNPPYNYVERINNTCNIKVSR